MRRPFCSAAVLAAVVLFPAVSAAGPVPWGFQVIDGPIDHVALERRGLGVGEYREPVLTRPVLDPNPPLPDVRTHWSDNYSVYDQNTRKVRVWMGTDDTDHDQWRSVSWSVSRRYKKTAAGTAWELDQTIDYFWPNGAYGQRSVMEFDNGVEAWDGLVNRVELWTEDGTMVLKMTPDVSPEVPEPATLALAAVGLGVVGLVRRRK